MKKLGEESFFEETQPGGSINFPETRSGRFARAVFNGAKKAGFTDAEIPELLRQSSVMVLERIDWREAKRARSFETENRAVRPKGARPVPAQGALPEKVIVGYIPGEDGKQSPVWGYKRHDT